MRRICLAVLLAFSVGLMSCTTRTSYGECIGAFEDGDPALDYDPSILNIILGVIFMETIVVPVVVVVGMTRCPEGPRRTAPQCCEAQ